MRRAGLLLVAVIVAGCASGAQREASQARQERLIATNVQLAAMYLARDQLDFAQEKLQKALEIDDSHTDANNIMALLKWRLKEYDAAERHFRVAVQAENPAAQNNYGTFLCDRGRIDEAVTRFRRAIASARYATPAEANENAGICLLRKPDVKAAEAHFRAALELDPRRPRSLYEMARLSFEKGRPLAARGFLQRFFELTSDTPEALLLAVRIEGALGNKNEESSYAVRLRGKFPDSPEAKQLPADLRGRRG